MLYNLCVSLALTIPISDYESPLQKSSVFVIRVFCRNGRVIPYIVSHVRVICVSF